MIEARDLAVRLAAAEHVRRIATADTITGEQLAAGFTFDRERVPLVNLRRGIFKPQTMEHLLSVRTVFPRSGARVWYDDQRVVHEQVTNGRELVEYAFETTRTLPTTGGCGALTRPKSRSSTSSVSRQGATPPFGRLSLQSGSRLS